MKDPLRHVTNQSPAAAEDEAPAVRLQNVAFVNSTSNHLALDSFDGSFDGVDGNHEPKWADLMISADHFDETGYLSLHTDVQEAIERGDAESGYKHYLLYGRAEYRA